MASDSLLPVKNAGLPIAIEAMGGDLGCSVAVEGAVMALLELGISSILVGDESEFFAHLSQEFDISAAILAKRKALTQINLLGVKTVMDNIGQEIFRRLTCKFAGSGVSPFVQQLFEGDRQRCYFWHSIRVDGLKYNCEITFYSGIRGIDAMAFGATCGFGKDICFYDIK